MSTTDQPSTDAAKLQEAADEMKAHARSALDEAQRTAHTYAAEGKTAAADQLTGYAKAVRSASAELGAQDRPLAAQFVTEAADELDRVAQSLAGNSVSDLLTGAERFARRNPGAFAIGAVLAGLAIGRFAKATTERRHDADDAEAGPPGPTP